MLVKDKEAFAFLDGLRGLAALQVVFLHYFSAFLPATVYALGPQHFEWEATFSHSAFSYPLAGYSAVDLFFVMSGFVLAQSFIKARVPVWHSALKRFVRLFIPVAVATVIAASLSPAIHHWQDEALSVSGSGWLADIYLNPMSWRTVSKDVFLSSMLVGYDGPSLLQSLIAPFRLPIFSPQNFALNAPMWTLHGEFWGSMLVLFLALAFKRLPAIWFAAMIVLLLAFTGTSLLSVFVIGFLIYLARRHLLGLHGYLTSGVLSVTLLGAGVWLCVDRRVPEIAHLNNALAGYSHLGAITDDLFQDSIGAVLVFLAVMVGPVFRRALSLPLLRFLGRLSFSIYLLHFPIMLSLGGAVFAAISPYGYLAGVAASIAVGTACTLICAYWFEQWVDAPSISLSRSFAAAPGLRPVDLLNVDPPVRDGFERAPK
jgi:peptidoglycan/LPS O-acetylase OafA/YrhL